MPASGRDVPCASGGRIAGVPIVFEWNPGSGGILSARSSAGRAEIRQEAAHDLLSALPSTVVERLKKKRELRSVSVEVRQIGNSWAISGVRVSG